MRLLVKMNFWVRLEKSQKQMALSNFCQQTSGLVLFLTIPNILTTDQYASVVALTTAISFLGFADLGLGNAYSREISGLVVEGDATKVKNLDKSIFWGKLYLSTIGASIFSVIFYILGHPVFESMSLAIAAIVLTVVQMVASKFASQEQFNLSKNVITVQAFLKLLQIPLAWEYGVYGWLVGFVLAVFSPVLIRDVRLILVDLMFGGGQFNLNIIKSNFKGGVKLGLITLAWGQLLNVGRLMASLNYSNEVLSAYGVVSGLYQVVGSLLISISVPQTIKIYKMFEISSYESYKYSVNSALRMLPIVFVLVISMVVLFPIVAPIAFPKITIDSWVVFFIMCSLLAYPALIALGSYLVAARRYTAYLSAILLGLFFAYGMEAAVKSYSGYRAASVAQFFSIVLYVTLMSIYIRVANIKND